MSHRFYTGALICTAAILTGSCAERRTTPGYGVRLSNTPPALLQLDQGAQAITAAAPQERWPAVYSYVQTMENAWRDYRHPTAGVHDKSRQLWESNLRGEVDGAMARLRHAALARDSGATVQAANDVDTAVLNLFQYYEAVYSQAISVPHTR